MARDANFTRISRRDMMAKQSQESAIESRAVPKVDKPKIDKNVADKATLVEVYDKVFFNHVMLTFENNNETNSCFFNDLKDRADSDFSKSYNIELDPLNTCLKLSDKSKYGEYWTREIFSNEHADSKMNNFFLMVDQDVPPSGMVKYYLVTEKDEVYPIQANGKNSLVIRHEDSLPTSVRIKAVVYPSSGEMTTEIKGMALLYEDDSVSKQVDIFRPEFDMEIVDTPEDIVTLFRDPLNDDTLFKVESSSERILLEYNDEGELSGLGVYNIKNGNLKSDIDMIYEDYTNSQGETEKVLSKIRTRNSTNKK